MPRRAANELRTIKVTPHFLTHPEGSVLIEMGDTRVICTASIDDNVPRWMRGKGRGWVTAEYDMLPRATNTRNQRDSVRGKINGRTQEISRLIGRALRAVADLDAIGERTITVDCDVIQADGGTRTASITGAYIALAIALKELEAAGKVKKNALKEHVAAISVGIIDGEAQLDLDYRLDSTAEVDMNVVMGGNGEFVEVQGTGEGFTFKREGLDEMLDLALHALPSLVEIQKKAIAIPFSEEKVTVTL